MKYYMANDSRVDDVDIGPRHRNNKNCKKYYVFFVLKTAVLSRVRVERW
jgi:hypothetical protein